MPDLANRISAELNNTEYDNLLWTDVLDLLELLLETAAGLPAKYAGNRTKQWLCYLVRQYDGARQLFPNIKRLRDIDSIATEISRHRSEFGLQTVA